MRDRDDGNVILQPDEHDVVRKVVDWKTPNIRVGDARHERPRRRELLEVLKRMPNLGRKPFGHLGASFAVPFRRFTQLTPCAWAHAYTCQRDSTSR